MDKMPAQRQPTLAEVATARAAQRALEAEAEDALSRIHGTQGLHAVALALLLPAGKAAALQCWAAETKDMPGAAAMLAHAQALSGATRLPWLERMAHRLRGQPVTARRAFLVSTRRLMSAEGSIQPIDRLHWLALRQWLGEPSTATQRAAAQGELSEMLPADVQALARFSAFLSRLVPGPVGDENADLTESRIWYAAVMQPWRDRPEATFDPPDADAMVTALLALQSLAWMQRPMLLRAWVDAAVARTARPPPQPPPPKRHRQALPDEVETQPQARQPKAQAQNPSAKVAPSGLQDSAADALRLTGALLDCPLPPELARHYSEPVAEPRR